MQPMVLEVRAGQQLQDAAGARYVQTACMHSWCTFSDAEGDPEGGFQGISWINSLRTCCSKQSAKVHNQFFKGQHKARKLHAMSDRSATVQLWSVSFCCPLQQYSSKSCQALEAGPNVSWQKKAAKKRQDA